MAEGDFDLACARFRDSDKLDPAVGTRFNLADCEERRGRVATAWSLFRGVLAELGPTDDRRPIAEERARLLESRLPTLTLTRTAETPPGLTVRVDGVELGEGSFGLPLPMDPGPHELTLQAPGHAPERTGFTLKEGEPSALPLRFTATAAPPPSAEPEPAAAPAAPVSDGTARRRWAYIVGGVGASGVALGAVTGVVALNKKSTADANCRDALQRCNEVGVAANESGKRFAAISTIGFSVGIVGLAAGAYLWLTSAPPSRVSAHSSTPARIAPELVLNEDQGFVGVSGTF